MALQAWGQLPAAPAAEERWWSDRDADLPKTDTSLLAYGNGRSYGDVCLNSGATLLHLSLIHILSTLLTALLKGPSRGAFHALGAQAPSVNEAIAATANGGMNNLLVMFKSSGRGLQIKCRQLGLTDDATAQTHTALIDHHRLPRRHRPLGFRKLYLARVCVDVFDFAGCVGLPIACFGAVYPCLLYTSRCV